MGRRSITREHSSEPTVTRVRSSRCGPVVTSAVVDAAKERLETFVHGCSYVHPNEPVAELAGAVSEHLRQESGVVMGVGGYYKNVMRFQPPLTITRDQLEIAVDGLRSALDEVA